MANPKEELMKLQSHMEKKPFLSTKDKLKAGAEITGKVIKTVGKRMVGDDSETELSPNAKAFMTEQTKDSK